MSDKTRKPNIPEPSDPRFGEALRETIEVGEGLRGDPLDRKLTLRDALDSGLVTIKPGTSSETLREGGGGLQPTGSGPGGEGGQEDESEGSDSSAEIPRSAEGVSALGTFSEVVVTWMVPEYSGHAYTEIARAESDQFSESVVIGSESGSIYVDAVGGGFSAYYWVRHTNREGMSGQWVGPVYAETAKHPEYMLEQLTGDIANTDLYKTLQKEIGVEQLQNEWTVKVGSRAEGEPPVIGGIGLASEDGSVDMGVLADRFWLAHPDVDYSEESKTFPFIVKGGEVHIDTAMIADASIGEAKIGTVNADSINAGSGTINVAKIDKANIFDLAVGGTIQSDRYDQDGGFSIARDGSIVVKDANGNIRVKIGKL